MLSSKARPVLHSQERSRHPVDEHAGEEDRGEILLPLTELISFRHPRTYPCVSAQANCQDQFEPLERLRIASELFPSPNPRGCIEHRVASEKDYPPGFRH